METQNFGNDTDRDPRTNDKLLGGGVAYSNGDLKGIFGRNESDFELLEGDANMSMVEGIPAIAFSDRINDILFKKMELTVILKLLGRNIGYNVLHNRILNLWKPAKSFHLMGPGMIFGQYLTVQLWTKTFNPVQPYLSVVMAWIRLPGLPGYLYKRKIIEAIGGLIGKVVKLDLQTDNRTRGPFAHLAVFINLDKPLVSQVLVDGAVQRVEYEALSTICFCCGKYGHVKELCPSVVVNPALGISMAAAMESPGDDVNEGGEGKRVDYGPWMLVERKSRHGVFRVEKEASSEAVVVRGNKAKASSKGDLGYAVGVDRRNNVGFSLAQTKVDDTRMNRLVNEKLGGLREDSPGGRGSENKVGNNRGGASLNHEIGDNADGQIGGLGSTFA
ncbi:hypothetical protein J1N35_017014 [Gossypium stocksii]|uniref:CCHC-type domain-containing protein n=1 Tax=Gossypium stocksii TaxID=47602 RepID=A0A9D3VMA3_9ROSI|nr:hypothetical protein J1N35_017014 [Gossypium stocksii]